MNYFRRKIGDIITMFCTLIVVIVLLCDMSRSKKHKHKKKHQTIVTYERSIPEAQAQKISEHGKEEPKNNRIKEAPAEYENI